MMSKMKVPIVKQLVKRKKSFLPAHLDQMSVPPKYFSASKKIKIKEMHLVRAGVADKIFL